MTSTPMLLILNFHLIPLQPRRSDSFRSPSHGSLLSNLILLSSRGRWYINKYSWIICPLSKKLFPLLYQEISLTHHKVEKCTIHTSLTTSFPPFSPVNSSYASSSSSGLMLLVFLIEVSDLRRMGDTGVESSSTATEFIEVIDVSMNAWVGEALVVVCFTGGVTGADIL
jgi:hypothetical protein